MSINAEALRRATIRFSLPAIHLWGRWACLSDHCAWDGDTPLCEVDSSDAGPEYEPLACPRCCGPITDEDWDDALAAGEAALEEIEEGQS